MDQDSPAPLGREGLAQNSHHVRIHTTGPNQSAVRNRIRSASGRSKKLIARVTPVSSRASSRATSPMKTNKNKNKRQASSSSDEGATCSDSTVVGSDSESENSGSRPAGDGHRPIIGAHIPCKRCKALPAAVQQTQTTSTAPVESTRNPVSASTQAVTAKTAPRTGAKPTAPPRPKLPPPIFLRKGANFLQISADCTRLRINRKAVRTADDGIKIHCPDVETFRSLNKYLVDFKVQFHTYALEEERKLKAVIRGIPTDFPVDEIQADLCGQGFPVHSVHRLCQRRLTIMASSRQAPHRKVQGSATAASCTARGRQLSCGPALREMFGPTLDQRVPAYSPVAPPRDLNNFPDLAGNKPTPGCRLSPASNPWGKPKPTLPPRAAPGPSGEAVRREPPVSLPASATAGTSSFGDDIQTVMSILRAVKSSEISEFARDFRACSNVEEKLMVLVRYHHLMVKLESI
ncbi:hypothetical protein EVAR_25091_1 [Eumeta japonica]|uniref:Nucleic-acid-binding protein from transposon X-element n=1 Tax=Eumeta variegata TaxID=151549 RepID=A0A4C1Z3I0_EUMVA|nr:hypothetical protein EVAR_25091_1 [Eumeta japonica]